MPLPVTADLIELAHRLLYRTRKEGAAGLRAERIPSLLRRLRRAGDDRIPPRSLLESQAGRAAREGMEVMLSGEEDWPEALDTLPQPPFLLFSMGKLPRTTSVALIGSRRCSRNGREMARMLGRGLAAAGVVVGSGLARGIDGQAHEGALERGLGFAVLGGGLDRIYPPEHRGLAVRIRESGALLSEFPPGVSPLPFHFPRRNRLLAALTRLTVVVEAGEKSGALITVQHAVELGRNVGVVPGHPLNPAAAGSNRLLFEGAAPVGNVQDVLDLLKWGGASGEAEPWNPDRCRKEAVEDIEVLALRSGWTLARCLETLAAWEREGRVRRLAGGRFEVLA